MEERTFIEEIGTPFSVNAIGSARAWEIRHLKKDSTIPPHIYVIESDIAQQFLLGRQISGRHKFNMIRYLAKSFVELFFEQLRDKELFQYIILRGAYPFDLQYAFGSAPPYDRHLLPTGFIKLQRVLNQEGADWEIHAQNFIGEYQGRTWLIPDTVIASGATITYLLQNGFEHHLPQQVYVIAACGSLEGIQRIYRECLKKQVELIPVFFQCLFEVSKIGNLPDHPLTDLSVVSPGSITTKSFFERAFHRYQGTRMCCVGDIGQCLENPTQYSIHTLWEMQILGMDPSKEDWETWTVDVRTKEFQEKALEFNPDFAQYFKDLWK